MDQLLWDGINLMALGMGAVFVFLSLLVLTTTLMSKIVIHYTPPESDASVTPVIAGPQPNQVSDGQLLAVISAAIHRHRSRHK